MAGLGVSRGRLPGAAPAGCRGSGRDCEPRVDGTKPMPGTTGAAQDPSDGVALNALPQRSTAQAYDVSASTFGNAAGDATSDGGAASNGGGIAGNATSIRTSAARRARCASDSSRSTGTST